jgi:hypothetical protein
MKIERLRVAGLAFSAAACLAVVFAGSLSPATAEDALRALQNPGAAPAAPGQSTIGGEWSGKYQCRQGITGVHMVFSQDGSRALFHFYGTPENPGVPEGCFSMSGFFDPASRTINLTAGQWLLRPRNYNTANISGGLDGSGQIFAGQILGPPGCTAIIMRREPTPRPLPNVCERGLP